MNQTSLHITPESRITWNKGPTAYWVTIEENRSSVTIFVNDEETAIRLCGTLQVARQRIVAKVDRIVEKLTKQDKVDA